MILLDDLGIWVVGLGEAERIDADADAALDDIKLPCISMIPSFPLCTSRFEAASALVTILASVDL
jgi:hypothetical protein